jgi:hypothetical protein
MKYGFGFTQISSADSSRMRKVASLPEGGLISPKEFLHLVNRGAIDMAV